MKTLLLVAVVFTSAVHAGEFDNVEIAGACKKQNTQIIENGDSLSILFDDFDAEMPAGETGDGLDIHKACQFKVRMTHPRGKYLASLRQVFSGGVIKSKGARGQLNLIYGIDMKNAEHQPIIWKWEEVITPEMASSLFTRTIVDNLPEPPGCNGKSKYVLHIGLRAARRSLAAHFIGGLDSYDAQRVKRLRLIPTWKPCRQR